jgi:drug/metabolite transporter (DMT)-like permease
MPLWLMLAGAALAVVGAIVMSVASGRQDKAQLGSDFSRAYGGLADPHGALASAVTLGHIGLGIMIFGGALILVGLAAQAMRR